jgi:hypothetical protein
MVLLLLWPPVAAAAAVAAIIALVAASKVDILIAQLVHLALANKPMAVAVVAVVVAHKEATVVMFTAVKVAPLQAVKIKVHIAATTD